MKTAVLVALAGIVAFGGLAGWALMLAIGLAHHEWWPIVPTIGFWPAAGLGVLLRLALFTPSSGSDS